MIEFYLKTFDDRPDELRMLIEGEDKPATKAHAKQYPEAYQALKKKMASEPPREPWEARRNRKLARELEARLLNLKESR